MQTINITPEIHERALQQLADNVLCTANGIGYAKQEFMGLRERFGMDLNPASAVSELSAQLGVKLAQLIASGEGLPECLTFTPAAEEK